ncbi:uncharacterized protein LOC115258807 [Aedes albopictus]|uniref:CCHC-type domain-containing protein n=1 Tax=Aedes albopictus TaxID=7160 RepID=A0ABM1YXV8_AEDAL|nr:uncharacterized protein LOC115258807 [Aedes albopictus]
MEWFSRLKKLAANCDFGLRRGPLFEQRGLLDVHKIQQGAEKKQCKSDSRCFACERGDHDFRKCKYNNSVCKLCDKKGHLAKVCPTKESEQPKEKKKPYGQKRGPRISHLWINKLEPTSGSVMVGISVNGCPVRFEVDTGSPVNAISKDLYDHLFSVIPLNTDLREEFVCYNGSGFRAVDTFEAELRYKEHMSKEKLYVFEGTRQPLFGRPTMCRWNLKIDCHISEKKVDCKQ